LKVGIPKESHPGERRVAGTPGTVRTLREQGFTVLVERGAGASASYPDPQYEAAGATLVDSAGVWQDAEIILKVRPPSELEAAAIHEGAHLICFVYPAQNTALVERLAKKRVTLIAMDCVPRISRAQKLDALSSMANAAGYRAVIEAAQHFGSFFTGQITAAGRVQPAKVLVIGAGVAGLAAIAAARGLGAIVRAFDTREAVRDQVKSLGAEFLELEFDESGDGAGGYAKVMSEAFIEAEMALFEAQAAEVDIVITTALIPGRPAPKLWQARAVERMKPGSVVVDLAAEQGGNCELCVPGEIVVRHGVTIMGLTDLPSRMATVTSNLYGTNLTHLLDDMGRAAGYRINLDDEVIRQSIVLHDGELMWPPPRHEPEVEPEKDPAPEPSVAHPAPQLTGPAVAAEGHRAHPARPRPRRDDRPRARRALDRPALLLPRRDHPAARLPATPHRLRARLLRRLAGHLERHGRAAHPVDGGHQRHQRHHHRRWALASERIGQRPQGAARRGGGAARHHQHRGWLPRHPAHAQDVSEVGG
jgi:NAD(P) transhydrogenase subunit alpha